MLRSELIQSLVEANPGLPPDVGEAIISCFFDAIIEQLAAGGRVEMRGFGNFSTRTLKAHTGVNPVTRTAIELDDRRVPHFKPSKLLRLAPAVG